MSTYLKTLAVLLFFVLCLFLFGVILGKTFNSLVISFVAAYFIFPLIIKLEKFGIPRTIVVLFTTIVVLLIVLLLGLFLVPLLLEELASFVSSMPEYFRLLIQQLISLGDAINMDVRKVLAKYLEEEALLAWVQTNIASISKYVLVPFIKLSKSGLGSVLNLLMFLVNLFIIPIFFYFLIASYEKVTHSISDLFPPKQREIMKGYLVNFNTILNGYFRGQLALSLFLSTYFSIMLSLLGVKFGLLIGVCTGILNVIPYVGVTVSIFLSAISVFTYSNSAVFDFLMLLLIYGGEAAIEAPFIYPRLVGSKVNLRPLETMLALAAGANLGGILGVLVAIPAAASLKFIVIDAIKRYRSSSFYLEKDYSG